MKGTTAYLARKHQFVCDHWYQATFRTWMWYYTSVVKSARCSVMILDFIDLKIEFRRHWIALTGLLLRLQNLIDALHWLIIWLFVRSLSFMSRRFSSNLVLCPSRTQKTLKCGSFKSQQQQQQRKILGNRYYFFTRSLTLAQSFVCSSAAVELSLRLGNLWP